MQTTISTENNKSMVTLINVFIVDPANQDKLVQILTEATEKVMRHLKGFISANLHKSLDGVRVVNYAQWASKEDFEAIFRNPAALEHMEQAKALVASFDPHLHHVAEVFHN